MKEVTAYRLSASRRYIALAVWVASCLMFLLPALWNINADKQDAESRLRREAGYTATQLAALLSLPAWEMDELAARSIVMAAMENEAIYAIAVQAKQGMLEGQRRNRQWEPVPWDDEIEENAIQGKSLLKMEGHPAGSVEVYFSTRRVAEELALKSRREVVRVCVYGAFSTAVFLTLLWAWGDMALLQTMLRERIFRRRVQPSPPASITSSPQIGITQAASGLQQECTAPHNRSLLPPMTAAVPEPTLCPLSADLAAGTIVSAELGRAFLLRRPEAWRVTAGLFGQTFAHAPLLLLRLFEEADIENLCRLGRTLEHAAPSVGAERLAAAAHTMQTALNDPECERAAVAVESCVAALQEVLGTLSDGAQLRTDGMPPME